MPNPQNDSLHARDGSGNHKDDLEFERIDRNKLTMNKTTRNIFKSLLISALITCAISALYGVTSFLLEVSTLENQSINEFTIVMMVGASVTAFLYIEPIIWLITFALLQRFQTSNSN